MTIQIGMVGSDGIVLASDTKWTETRELRNSVDSSKIVISHERGIAISCARNMETAVPVAKAIMAELSDADWEHPELPIESICKRIIDESGDRNDVQALVVASCPTLRLFRLQTGTMMPQAEWVPICQEITGKAVVGDDANAATFWAEAYYECHPINALALLAAQLVTSASRLNSGGIGGLEVVLCDKSGIHRLATDSNRKLEWEANQIDEHLRSSFAGYAQEFAYTPKVIR